MTASSGQSQRSQSSLQTRLQSQSLGLFSHSQGPGKNLVSRMRKEFLVRRCNALLLSEQFTRLLASKEPKELLDPSCAEPIRS